MSRDYLLVGSTPSAAPSSTPKASPLQLELFPQVQHQQRMASQAQLQQKQKRWQIPSTPAQRKPLPWAPIDDLDV